MSTANISVTFRHVEPSPAIKTYATEKVEHCIQRFLSAHAETHIILSCEKRDHTAEAVVRSRGVDITSKATTDDLYSAIDKLVDNLSTQLRKHKEKISDHKQHAAEESVEG